MKNFFSEINYYLNRYLTPILKWLIISSVLIFLFQYTILLIFGISDKFIAFFAQNPYSIIYKFQIWRMITYCFIHANGMHLLFNMLALWFFAPEIEIRFGTKKFIGFILITGIGAALVHTIFVLIQAMINAHGEKLYFQYLLMQPIIGSSGIVYGILVANLIYYPDRTVLFNFLLPMKMKYFVIIMIVLEFLGSIGSAQGVGGMNDSISHITHLGGALVAYIYIKISDYNNTRRFRKNIFQSNRFSDF
jgi:membrane associated rhomboid family serine protease